MLRNFFAVFLSLLTVASLCRGVVGDEIVIGNRPSRQSLSSLGLDSQGQSDQSRLITAGELWQFFHEQGITSVDQLTLNLDCGGQVYNHAGAIRFQIQDPTSGNILTNLSVNSSTNRLEVPLEFDYMKRFSKGSKELIRLDLSELDALASQATVTVDSDAKFLGTFNVALVVGFFSFWVVVFFMLNRFTRPIGQDQAEDIIVLSNVVESDVEVGEPAGVLDGNAANKFARTQNVTVANTASRTGHSSKMVSAQ